MGERFGKDPDTIIHGEEPLNAEPPLKLLRRNFLTPAELFFVRNHGNVPEVDPEGYRLFVSGMVESPLELSFEEIRDGFRGGTVTAALCCAGNRRRELAAVREILGELPWGAGAVGNTLWTGIPLREILRAAGILKDAKHVAFTGLDEVPVDGRSCGFGGSITVEKATDPGVLLAYEMNGEPLRPEHGFPLRVVVPGYVGARSVKWLSRVELREAPSDNRFQAREYRLFPPNLEEEPEDPSLGFALGDLPVNAAICAPEDGEALRAGPVSVCGYAIAGGERRVERVDLSADAGKTWSQADLAEEDYRPGAWRLWQAKLELPPGRHRIVVRAVDSAADTQPEDPRSVWNPKGYVNNAWHAVVVNVL